MVSLPSPSLALFRGTCNGTNNGQAKFGREIASARVLFVRNERGTDYPRPVIGSNGGVGRSNQ
jgi:hypothetical protein